MTDKTAKLGIRSEHAKQGTIGLIGHVVTDFPDPSAARAMIRNMAETGVRIIEVQIPFSEPVADGPVFMAANHYALAQGVHVKDAFNLMNEVTAAHPAVDFIFMTYLNIVYKAGYSAFAERASKAGARAVIIPDLPLENSAIVDKAFAEHHITNIKLVAPNTSDERLEMICREARGFVYAVARSGVTGGATTIDTQLSAYTSRIRAHTDAPIGLGFGIRTAADIRRLKGISDYAIIGTAALQAWEAGNGGGGGNDVSHRKFWESMKEAAKNP